MSHHKTFSLLICLFYLPNTFKLSNTWCAVKTIEAFGLMRTQQDLHINDRLLTFDSVIRNVISSSVDLTSSSLTAPQSASPRLYWMIIAVEVSAQTPARVQLTNTNLIISKFHSNNSGEDIITKAGLVQLEPAIVVVYKFLTIVVIN